MATIDDKDKKIGEVPHLEKVTGKEKIPVSSNGEPRFIESQQIADLVEPSGFVYNKETNSAVLRGSSGSVASGENSVAEGDETKANGECSHAEGHRSTAYGQNSHAEGYRSAANGSCSHAEGYSTGALGEYSHTEGYNTTANRSASHAEGYEAVASGMYSHAEGRETITYNFAEHAEGFFNKTNYNNNNNSEDRGNKEFTLHTVGNGLSKDDRHNAFQIMQSGDIYIPDVEAEGKYYEKPMLHLQTELKKADEVANAMKWRRLVDPYNGHEYVDMGEAGIWAKYPIGVTNWKTAFKDVKYFV